jgi:two-component system, chemotaxis family, chemotaxis protein CheY
MVTILIADDSDYIRDLLKKVTYEAGHSVVGEAANADEAIAQYKKLLPNVVLMDLVLETGKIAKTGLDAIKQIVAFDPRANIVVCSGLDEQLMINASMAAGAKAFVAKPVEMEKLLQTIVMCTDLRIIAEMGRIGAERSALVLSKLTKQPIQVELSRLESGPPRLLTQLSGVLDHPATIIKMGLQTKPNCDALLVFESAEAIKTTKIMLETSGRQETQEIQMSAFKELGSNMICAFFAAVADFADLSLVPSPPSMSLDVNLSVINSLIEQQTDPVDLVLIFQIQVKRKIWSASGFFILIPSAEFQKQLIEAGQKSITPILSA